MLGLWDLMGTIMVLLFLGFIFWAIKSAIPHDAVNDIGRITDRITK